MRGHLALLCLTAIVLVALSCQSLRDRLLGDENEDRDAPATSAEATDQTKLPEITPTDLTPAEIAKCKKNVLAAARGKSKTHGNYAGGYLEVAGTRDPTGGLMVMSLPLKDGPLYGQMVNTYLDCSGHLGAGGTYRGRRAGNKLYGAWTMRQLSGTFGGKWTSTAKGDNRRIEGTYTVTSGPKTSMPCKNPDGTQFGIDGCYCVSPGSFALIREGSKPGSRAIPFEVVRGNKLALRSRDNPRTSQNESHQGQRYAIVDAEQVCTNELPLVALCLNPSGRNPLEVQHSASCAVELPITRMDPRQLSRCSCLFLQPLVKGKWYIAVGINSVSGVGGLNIGNLDAVSFQSFQH